MWHGCKLAPVRSNGVEIGWGATCGRHLNDDDHHKAGCKKQLLFGMGGNQITPARAQHLVKQWVVTEPPVSARTRSAHVQMNPRIDFEPMTEAAVEAAATALEALG